MANSDQSPITSDIPAWDDREILRAFLDATKHLSLREAAEVSGVSVGTISRLRAERDVRIFPSTRRKLEDAYRRVTKVDKAETGAGEGPDLRLSLSDIEQLISRIGAPGEAASRKSAALEGVHDFFAAVGTVPDWLYELRSRVERGEL